MKHLIVFLCLSFFTSELYSQVVLTNGLTYNYSVGDTIEYYTQVSAGPPISYTVSYLQKTVKVDTIIYQVKQQYYQPPSCMTCSASAGINTYTYQVTDLNSNAAHFALTNTVCTTQYDSSYTNGCGQIVNLRQTNWGPTCFEPDMYTSYLIEGVGLFYVYSYGLDPNHYNNSKTLTYYHKVGQVPCGANGMPLNISKHYSSRSLSIYPNPVTQHQFFINNTQVEHLNISVFSIDGKEVYSCYSNDKSIEINKEFESGIYFVRFKNSEGESFTNKLVIE